jgi:hypothetical protein
MMKSLFAAVLATVGLVVASSSASAFGHRRDHCCSDSCAPAPVCCAPAPAPQITWVDKTVTCYRPVMREKQIECVVNRVVPREVVTPLTRTCMVPETRMVEKTITVCKMVPREVVKQVPVCVMVSTPCVDPCTGCTYNVCKPQTVMKEVRCCVMERVAEQRTITVPVCTYKPVTETVQCKRIVCDVIPEKQVRTVRYCEMEAYQKTVKVPVCQPVCQ